MCGWWREKLSNYQPSSTIGSVVLCIVGIVNFELFFLQYLKQATFFGTNFWYWSRTYRGAINCLIFADLLVMISLLYLHYQLQIQKCNIDFLWRDKRPKLSLFTLHVARETTQLPTLDYKR